MKSKRYLPKIYYQVLVLVLISLFMVSCSQPESAPGINNEESVEDAPEIVFEGESRVIMTSYYELAQYSDIIIVGRIVSEEGVINTAREPLDSSIPDKHFFTVAQVYKIEVDQYLKGNGPGTIYITQKEGKFFNGETPQPQEIDAVRTA